MCWCNVGFSKISPAKHVDACVDSDEDRGSTPLASTFYSKSLSPGSAQFSENGFVASNLAGIRSHLPVEQLQLVND